MLHFEAHHAYTDSPHTLIRRRSTGEIFPGDIRGYIADPDDYQEITADQAAADRDAQASRQAYVDRVRAAVHQRYTLDDETALLRKALAAITDPSALTPDDRADALTAFTAYNTYVNTCRAQAATQATDNEIQADR